ncbi:MAG: hypothetical protein AB7O62_23500 [Pirellulales bacterium]
MATASTTTTNRARTIARLTRAGGAVLLAILLAVASVHVMLLRPGHVWGDDFSMYLLHARCIAEGRAFTDTPYIYNPDYAFLGPPAYPPIAPLLMAPVYCLFGLNLLAIKGLMVGCFVAALGFLALLVRQRLWPWYVALLLVLVGVNVFYLRWIPYIGSDAPFLVFLFLALWLMEMMLGHSTVPLAKGDGEGVSIKKPKLPLALAVGVTIYLAFGTRTVGGVLLPVLLVTDLLRSRRLSRGTLLASLVFALLVAAQYLLIRPTGGGYADQLNLEPLVLARNAAQYASRLVAVWSNGYWVPLAAALGLAFLVLALLGYVRAVRQRIGATEVFPVLYLGVILLFPSYQGERFLLPVLPLYVFYALLGLQCPWLESGGRERRWIAPTLVSLVLTTTAARLSAHDFGAIAEGLHRPESAALFDFVSQHTGPDDVFVFAKPRALGLMTGRRAAAFHRATDDSQMWDFLDRINAGYVVSFDNDRPLADEEERALANYLRAFIARHGQRLEPVYANPDFRVYHIRRNGAALPVGSHPTN